MLRKATAADLKAIEDSYNEHFDFKDTHPDQIYTVFQRGVYPTQKDAEKALAKGDLFVYEKDGVFLASVIANKNQPPEYADVPWQKVLRKDDVLIIHLLMVRSSAANRGVGTAVLAELDHLARAEGIKALRLDTGSMNAPAQHLYQKCGYKIVSRQPMKVGGALADEGHLFLEKLL